MRCDLCSLKHYSRAFITAAFGVDTGNLSTLLAVLRSELICHEYIVDRAHVIKASGTLAALEITSDEATFELYRSLRTSLVDLHILDITASAAGKISGVKEFTAKRKLLVARLREVTCVRPSADSLFYVDKALGALHASGATSYDSYNAAMAALLRAEDAAVAEMVAESNQETVSGEEESRG